MEKLKLILKKILIFFKGIWTFLNSRVFLYIIVISAFLFIANTCSSLRNEKIDGNIKDQNIIALNDSIKIVKLKNGEIEVSKAILILSEKELKETNKKLYDDVKYQKGSVISLNNIVFQLKQDKNQLQDHINFLESKMGKPIQLSDSSYLIPWTLRYDWDSINYDALKGQTLVNLSIKSGFIWKDGLSNIDILKNAFTMNHVKTQLLEKTSQIKLTFGQRVENDKYNVFVETKYPGFTPKSLEGILIDPNTNKYIKSLMKKKQFLPGTWSLGVGPAAGYNMLTGKPYFGAGINLNYTIFQW